MTVVTCAVVMDSTHCSSLQCVVVTMVVSIEGTETVELSVSVISVSVNGQYVV